MHLLAYISAQICMVPYNGRQDPDLARMKMIKEAYCSSRRSYGYRRIQIWVEKKYSMRINHKAVMLDEQNGYLIGGSKTKTISKMI